MVERIDTNEIEFRKTSFAEQEEEDLRYWMGQPLSVKVDAVAAMALYFARMNRIDIDAEGPKTSVTHIQRA